MCGLLTHLGCICRRFSQQYIAAYVPAQFLNPTFLDSQGPLGSAELCGLSVMSAEAALRPLGPRRFVPSADGSVCGWASYLQCSGNFQLCPSFCFLMGFFASPLCICAGFSSQGCVGGLDQLQFLVCMPLLNVDCRKPLSNPHSCVNLHNFQLSTQLLSLLLSPNRTAGSDSGRFPLRLLLQLKMQSSQVGPFCQWP